MLGLQRCTAERSTGFFVRLSAGDPLGCFLHRRTGRARSARQRSHPGRPSDDRRLARWTPPYLPPVGQIGVKGNREQLTRMASSTGRAGLIYVRVAGFFARLRQTSEQMDPVQRWYRILSAALRRFLHGRQLIPPAP
jgi:hypothetical protein